MPSVRRASSLLLLLGTAALAGLPSCGNDHVCPTSIEAVCQDAGACPMTWAAAQDAAGWQCPAGVVLSHCANVDTATLPNFDVATVFEYDVATGALFRIESTGSRNECIAGSGSLEECDDPNAKSMPCGSL
jgi:hypothetical protein